MFWSLSCCTHPRAPTEEPGCTRGASCLGLPPKNITMAGKQDNKQARKRRACCGLKPILPTPSTFRFHYLPRWLQQRVPGTQRVPRAWSEQGLRSGSMSAVLALP